MGRPRLPPSTAQIPSAEVDPNGAWPRLHVQHPRSALDLSDARIQASVAVVAAVVATATATAAAAVAVAAAAAVTVAVTVTVAVAASLLRPT